MKNKVTLFNMLTGFLLQICTIISGFIVPRIILEYFGSETNGLVSSVNQFLSFICLIEGGVTSVLLANLYKPIVENNTVAISSTIKTAKFFYKKICYIFIFYSIIISIVYPFFVKTNFSRFYIVSLILILSISLIVHYMFSVTSRLFLEANKKAYIVALTQAIITLLNILIAIISVRLIPSIHVLKIFTCILFCMQPIIFEVYIKKHYYIDRNAPLNSNLLKNRWNGFAINFAAFIHNSTDIVILTIFTDLLTVSIYSIYSLVTNGIKQLISSLTASIVHTIGQTYAEGTMDKLNNQLDLYEYIEFVLVFFAYSITGLLITPFVLIYTNNVSDAYYNQKIFGILLVISEAIYLLKGPHLNLAYSANKFKEISKPAYIEAALNILISICLVKKIGIIGVTIGTIIAMIYRMCFHVWYTKSIISNRKQFVFYKKIIIFSLTSIIGIILCKFVKISPLNVTTWIRCAIIYSIIMILLYAIISFLFFKKEIRFIFEYLNLSKFINF